MTTEPQPSNINQVRQPTKESSQPKPRVIHPSEISLRYTSDPAPIMNVLVNIIDESNKVIGAIKNTALFMPIKTVPPPETLKPQPEVRNQLPEVTKPTPEASKTEKPTPEVVRAKPEAAKPTPEVVKPKPESAKPTPEVIKPKPEIIKPSPEVTKPKVETAKPTSEFIPPKPFTSTKRADVPQAKKGEIVTYFITAEYNETFSGAGWLFIDEIDLRQVEIIDVTGVDSTDYKGTLYTDGYYGIIKREGDSGKIDITIKVKIK